MTEKRIRIYEGEQLERRRAYQREYNRKKRAAELEAKGLEKQTKPSPAQQFSLGKDNPRLNQPKLRKTSETQEIRNPKVKQRSNYWQSIEAELENAEGGLSMHNYEFFQQFRKQGK